MNAAQRDPSAPLLTSEDRPGAPPVERLTPDGLRPVCSEEVAALSLPRDACGQGGFSDEGQQQVLSADQPRDNGEGANPEGQTRRGIPPGRDVREDGLNAQQEAGYCPTPVGTTRSPGTPPPPPPRA